ncbi:protein PRRC2C isoform X2 [Parambassis ranga]|uniref:Protein PRRC2C isoform X2 n=1 Tax=Parambassis ranga TaxID=210632 RepID=A0A6P7IET3_9TELE|nr:protein PRRC2C isoform X2 [Parambassis ranga]
MSEKSGQSTKAKDGKTKYATLSLFNTYKGKSLETQKTAVAARHGLQSLGKVAASRRMPPPANLPSLKAENKGNDPNVNIVPKDGSGWASRTEAGDEGRQQETPPPQNKPAVLQSQELSIGGSRSWANSKQTQVDGSPRVSSHFHQEFPSLQAAGDVDKGDGQEEEPYGPGPSLRPQNVGSWREGGGRNLNTAPSPPEMDNRVQEEGSTGLGTSTPPEESDEPSRNTTTDTQREKRDGRERLPAPGPGPPQPKLNGGQQPPAGVPAHFDPAFRSMMPPYMFHAYPQMSFAPGQGNFRYPVPQDGAKGSRSARPQQPPPQSWLQDPDRPSIISATELKELDNLDTDTDEGWAGAQMEVDYTEKLNFSDDEENQAAKEKGENWEWMGKVERMRAQTSEGQEGWKEGSEVGGSKTSWADGVDPRAPSPGSMGQYSKSPQDYQGGNRSVGGGVPRGSKPQATVAPGADEDPDAWRQKRKKPEVSEAIERARRRREEEERRMEEQRLAACAEKLKRLNEKHRQANEGKPSSAQTSNDEAGAAHEEDTVPAPPPVSSPVPSVPVQSQSQAPIIHAALSERVDRDGDKMERERVEQSAEEEVHLPLQPSPPLQRPGAAEPPSEGETSLADIVPLMEENQTDRASVPIRDYFNMEDNRVDEPHLSLSHIENSGGEEVLNAPPQLEGEAAAAMRPSLISGYSKQFQKSLPPRFLRQQEQMKQQQWQQQQQQTGGSVSPSGGGSVPGTQQQHRSMYQPMGPHHQHLASMGFDPRWLMMQSYMDPRMMSGRPPMDMPANIHPGRMPPKQIVRREPGDNSSSSSDSFDHLSRPIRDHGLPSDSRMVWGSDPYPQSEPLPSVTPPKGRDDNKEQRPDAGLDLDRSLPAIYPQDHSTLDSRKSNFFRDPSESLSAFSQGPEDTSAPLDRVPLGSAFDPEDPGLPSGEEVEALGQAMLQRSVSQGSSHSLKLDEPRFEGMPLSTKSLELQDAGERADDKPQNELYSQAPVTSNRATPPADGLHKQEKLPLPASNKQKAELRWGGRSGAARREGPGGDRPVRRSGPIKKPVLRDMKEEREQREEREKCHERGERGDRSKKDLSSKAPSAAAAVSEGSRPQVEGKREPADAEETPTAHQRTRDSQPSSGAPTSSSQEEKSDKPPSSDKHPEPKLPSRKESSLPPRAYRRDDREREREREKEMDKDRERERPGDSGFKGRGRGEYYSRGRSYRGTYSGRGRGSRGRSRAEYPYREPRSRSDLPSVGGAAAFRNREESETRSESSDFEVIPKRRRRRGSDTDSESEGGRESASDTGPSDREPSTKPSRPLRRELPGEGRSGPHKPGFGPPHMGEKVGSRGDDESRPKPGFLPKGEPSRRGRGGLYSRRGGARERGGPRSAPLRRPAARDSSSQWPSKPMETFRLEETESTPRYDNPPNDRRPPKSDAKKFGDGVPQSSRERPRRSRPARPPRQDKPPRFRRLKEREAAVLASGESAPSPPVPLPSVSATAVSNAAPAPITHSPTLSRAPGTPLTVPVEVGATIPAPDLNSPLEASLPETSSPTITAVGTKSPDLSNQNSSDQANEEWETASESSDFNERREREERKGALEAANEAATAPAPAPPQGSLTPSKSPPDGGITPKREGAPSAKRSFSSQRPTERQNRRGNSGTKPGRSYTGGKGERRGGAKAGRKGPAGQQNSEAIASAAGGAAQKSSKDQPARRKDEAKQATKKPKENALSQFDLNNYASVVIIDDHPEVTTTEDPQSSANDDGFTEVVSRKQQKRLQDEEKRKKEEQTTQNWGKKGSGEKSRGGGGKLPPRFAKKQSSQQQQASQPQPPAASASQAQQPPPISAAPHPHLAPSQPTASPQTLEGTVAPLTSIPPATVDFTSKSLPPAPAQTHSTLGTELWENKVAGSTVLPDVKKLGPISPPQPPSVSAWNKPLTSFTGTVSTEGVKSGAEGSVELGIDSIQFGAPSSAGSTDSDGVPALLESGSENKLPAPKEQRQKQPRAGPIKTQKLPEMELMETKEYKPGPIGKERSLKNRKAKDARGGESEGMEGGVPGGGVSRATDSSPPTSDTAVPELGGDIEGMITVPSVEYSSNSKESVTDYTTPSSSLADSVPTGGNKMEESLVANVALPHSLPLPRRETLQQTSSLSTVSPATVDLTLKMESARKAWENSPSLEKNSPVTSSSSPITSCASSYSSFSSASMPQIPVASVTPSTSLSGSGTYTTSSLGTKTTTASDPPNICKVKPQQLQGGGLSSSSSSSSSNSFSQLGCVPPLLPQQQQTPQVYVSQSAAGSAAQIPAFYMDTSHLFNTPHPRLAPPSLAQQQGFQPGLSQVRFSPTAVQQIPIPIYAPLQGQPQHQHTHQAQLGLSTGPPVSQPQDLFSSSLQPYRSQQAFMQSSLSQPSMLLSGPSLHSYPGVQAAELGKPQSNLAYQQPSSTQHIPILFEPQLNQPSGMGGSQLIDTHLLQARQGMNQHSNMYSGQVQQHGQSSYYSNTPSPSSAMQQVTVPLPGSQLSLPNFGSGGGQPLLALPPTPPQAQPPNINRQPPVSQPYRGIMGPNHNMMQPPTSKMDMDLKLFGSAMDVKPGTPPVSARSTTPTSSPYRASSTSPSSQSSKMNSMLYQKQFQPSSAGMRMTQHFPGQFNPQILSQPSIVSPLVRPPHANSFGGVQRSPMGPQMSPNISGGLMPHPRPQHLQHSQHPPRGSSVPNLGPRGTQAALKAEQDLKAKQRAEVLQSTHKFFSEQQQQQQQLKAPQVSKSSRLDQGGKPTLDTSTPNHQTGSDRTDSDKPPISSAKPIRTGPIKPQAIKQEEGK